MATRKCCYCSGRRGYYQIQWFIDDDGKDYSERVWVECDVCFGSGHVEDD
jgi:hypothetical protein